MTDDGKKALEDMLDDIADFDSYYRDRLRAIAAYVATLEAEVQKLHGSISAWCEQYDRVNSENSTLEARATAAEERVKRLKMNLQGRDKFIVDHGLWSRFVNSLKRTKPSADVAGEKP